MSERNQPLKNQLQSLNVDDYQQLRDAYYRAAEGLVALLEVLERIAPERDGELAYERWVATKANHAFRNSQLGRML